MRLTRFRWWHIAEVLPIEEDLFGAEKWSSAMFWNELAQRHGIGRTLLEALLAEAARQEIKQTLLEVAVDNAPAQRLYATYDFEPVGIRRGYYQPSNTDALVMMRDA